MDADRDDDYVTLEPTTGRMRLWLNRIDHPVPEALPVA
jgi:hypothetical protein